MYKFLSENIISKINFNKTIILVQYGYTNGQIITEVLEKMNDDSLLFVFETDNKKVTDLLQLQDKRLRIYDTSAYSAKSILEKQGYLGKVDCIISTVGFSFFDSRKTRRIVFKSYALLKDDGMLFTYKYSLLIYYTIKHRFIKTKIKFKLISFSPIFIIEGIK